MNKLRRLLLSLLLSLSAWAQSPVGVTGTIQDATGNLATTGTVRFQLQPQSSSVLYFVQNTTIVAPQTATCGINASGQIQNNALSGPCQVWGNDVISPGNTTYTVCFFPNGNQSNCVPRQLITGATYSLQAPVFAPLVSLVPQWASITTNPVNANIIPAIDNVFNIGAPGARYANGYFTNLSVTNSVAAPLQPPTATIGGTLPSAASSNGKVYIITNASSAGDCTIGGGTARSLCWSNGTIWAPIGDGGTGGTATSIQGNPVNAGSVSRRGQRYIVQGSSSFTLASGLGYELADWGPVGDDSTDNCTALTNWATAVNTYSGSGIPTATCTMGVGDLAYKSSCGASFTIPMTLAGNCTIDYSGSGAAITLGPSGLNNFSNAQIPPYTVSGLTFIGGGSAAQGIHVNKYISDTRLSELNFINYGQAGANGASCPSWAILFDGGNNEAEVIDIFSWNFDSTANRCFLKTTDSTAVGSNTARIKGLHILSTAAPSFTSPCSGTAIYQDGSGSNISDSSIYGYAIPIRIGQHGIATSILNSNLDTAGCSANGSSAVIQYGDPGSSTASSYSNIIGNTYVTGGGHATYLLDVAGDSTVAGVFGGSNIIGNKVLNGTGTLTHVGCNGACLAFANSNFTAIAPASWAGFAFQVNALAGGASTPGLALGSPSTGFYSAGGAIETTANGTNGVEIGQNYLWVKNANGYAIGSSSNSWFSAPSSGLFTLGTTASGTDGGLKLAEVINAGTAATLTGTGACASLSSQHGGRAGGDVTCTGTTGASTLTIGTGFTAPNGWECHGSDVTHTLAGSQSTASTTAPVLTFSSVTSNDIVTFGCTAY